MNMYVSTGQQRIAQIAERKREEPLTCLNHYLDIPWLREAYRRLDKKKAVGVDGQTVEDYGEELEKNLHVLINRAKSGSYKAPPVRRVYIPKGDGKEKRPLGIPTTEDKILQKGITMILEPIYEMEFSDCSFGFRSGIGAHDALKYLWKQLMNNNVSYVLDIDIRKFFDNVVHGKLREVLRQRVRDGVIIRLINKWLKAGVLEGDRLYHPDMGTPQGGVISPLLANIYLDRVIDKWFSNKVLKRLCGKGFMVRYADDVVMGFEKKADALRVLEALSKRLELYGLQLHPEKTKIVPFKCPSASAVPVVKEGKLEQEPPGTFNFLGFTHYWGKARKGGYVVKRRTAKDRFMRGLKQINQWCKRHRHTKLENQHRRLSQKLVGHYGYYGITGNARQLNKFREQVKKIWRKWLNRRSNANKNMSWERFSILIREHFPLPRARVVHSIYAAKPQRRGTVCVNCARTGLWGSR